MGKCIRRREFIKTATFGTAAAFVAPLLGLEMSNVKRSSEMSRVIRATRAGLVGSDEKISADVVCATVDEIVIALTQTSSIRDAWSRLFPDIKTTDVIGFKTNCLNRKGLVSHPEVVYALAQSLTTALELNPNNVIIWDRSDSELSRGGYTINKSDRGIRCFGTLPKALRFLGIFGEGIGYDSGFSENVGPGADVHFSRILTEMCTYLVNVPVLKDHHMSGITLSMKNLYGVIDSPRSCHGNEGDPYLPNLSNTPLIREKTRLFFCDGLFGCYDGGPSGPAQWINRQLMASLDPVAIDTVGLEIIDRQRMSRKMEPVVGKARFLYTAERMGLGNRHPDKIDLMEI